MDGKTQVIRALKFREIQRSEKFPRLRAARLLEISAFGAPHLDNSSMFDVIMTTAKGLTADWSAVCFVMSEFGCVECCRRLVEYVHASDRKMASYGSVSRRQCRRNRNACWDGRNDAQKPQCFYKCMRCAFLFYVYLRRPTRDCFHGLFCIYGFLVLSIFICRYLR